MSVNATRIAGETVPLNPQYLLEALRAASSSSQELVHKASAQLKEWEVRQGYWTLLQDAYLDRSLPIEVRWIAVLQLKQGVDKYWRKNAVNAVSKGEKQHIRSRLLSSTIEEPQPQLAIQNAVMIAKIARSEYPLEWPKVFSELTDIIRESSAAIANGAQNDQATLRLTRSLTILLQVVKELASGRLSRTKSSMQSITPEVLKVLGDVYIGNVQVWQGAVQQQPVPEMVVQSMSISLLALKTMRRLLVAGYEFPNRAQEVNQAWTLFQQHIWAFYEMELNLNSTPEVHKFLKKHVISFGKMYLDISDVHPAAFGLLPNTLDLLGKYWQAVVRYGDLLAEQSKKYVNSLNGGNGIEESEQEEDKRKFQDKVALQGLRLFRACIKMVYHPTSTFRYRHQQEKDEVNQCNELLKNQLFTPQTVTHMMEVLVTKYFILRPIDLEEWEADPEGWNQSMEDSVESFEFLVRPCAEKLFNDFMVNHKDFLAEPLMNVFNSISTIAGDDILVKDAIYTAVGLAANVLHHILDFDIYVKETLVKEIQVQQPGYNILRRRIAIMIGQWVTVKIDADTRPILYQVFQHLLNREDPLNDLVVRLTAAHNLSKSIDEWDFRVDRFLPFVPDLFNKVMALIDEAEQTETRMGLLNVIGMMVDRLEHRVSEYADRIVQILPALWEQTGEEHLFKQAILAILTKIVNAMKSDSVKYHHMLVPLIRYSVDPDAGMQVYLLDDALELWENTVQSAPSPASADLLGLFRFLLPCLEMTSSAVMRRALAICESYVLLAPQYIIENYRVHLFTTFAELLEGIKAEPAGLVVNIVETLIRAAKEMGGDAGLNVIGTELVSSQFLVKTTKTLRDSWESNQSTGPNRTYPPNAVLLTDYFSLFARIATTSVPWFLEILQLISQHRGESVDVLIEWLLPEWFSHFSNMGHPKQRKLNCLALTMLLETGAEWILRRLQDLMTVWTDVVTEIREDEQTVAEKYGYSVEMAKEMLTGNSSLQHWDDAYDQEDAKSPERQRMNQLIESDPINTVNIPGAIKHYLEKAQNACGGPQAFQENWVVNVDKEVLNDFAKLGII